MHILHVLDHSIPLHSGYTFRTRAILNQQRKMGWQTSHLTGPKQGAVDQPLETVDELQFYRTPLRHSMPDQIPVLNQFALISQLEARIVEVVEEVKPDVIHAHSPALNGMAALRAARRCGLPLVYEIRAFWEDAAVDHGTSKEWGMRYRLSRALETRVMKGANMITTICNGLKNEIHSRGIPDSKVQVIPNAVDINSFTVSAEKDQQLQEQLGLQNAKVLGFLGSFYAYEGLDLLIQAMPELLKQDPGYRLLLVGGGPQEQALKQQVTDLGIEDAVVFTGRVPHQQVQGYYSLVDVLVYPRKAMRLTDLVTPLKPLEAMAQKKLVVASDVGGHKELIKDGDNGVLFEAGSVSSLVSAITGLIGQPERWPNIKDSGRSYVETERNWEVSVARYREVYGTALSTAVSTATVET